MSALGAHPIFSPKAFLISPPFGNWIGHPQATRVLGSFTLERRPGWWRRAVGVFSLGWASRWPLS